MISAMRRPDHQDLVVVRSGVSAAVPVARGNPQRAVRRAHDLTLARQGAIDDGLTEFTDVIKQDVKAGKSVLKTYAFDRIELTLFLPKLSTQASRLVGVSLHGTSTLITRDASGKVLSQQTSPYAKSWGLQGTDSGPNLIINDYSDLALA